MDYKLETYILNAYTCILFDNLKNALALIELLLTAICKNNVYFHYHVSNCHSEETCSLCVQINIRTLGSL